MTATEIVLCGSPGRVPLRSQGSSRTYYFAVTCDRSEDHYQHDLDRSWPLGDGLPKNSPDKTKRGGFLIPQFPPGENTHAWYNAAGQSWYTWLDAE